MKFIKPKRAFQLAKDTFSAFGEDNALKFSASLAYYTTLSIGPLILIIISTAGLLLGQDAIEGKIFTEMRGLLGDEAARTLQDIIKNISLSGKSTLAAVIGFVTLLVSATTIFGDIQDSINKIWKVKPVPKRGWLKMLKDRFRSSSLIIGIGFLMVVTLFVNGLVTGFGDFLVKYIAKELLVFIDVVNVVISFLVIALLFGIIFKVLPDVKIKWKDVRAGSIFTAILFMLGRWGINLYITTTGAGSAYGAAGTVIILLVWVYYTAAILYLGAEFTKVFADYKGRYIAPAEYAVHIEQRQLTAVELKQKETNEMAERARKKSEASTS